jgi:CDP-diacylglycerol--glycerol-3-phosphate 3-phosphatidyltransferase
LPVLTKLLRTTVRKITLPIGRLLARLGLTPNAVTVLGFVVVTVASGLIATHHLIVGGIVTLAGGVIDALDGAVARGSGHITKRGAFLDSSLDRLSDGLIFGALAWHFASASGTGGLTSTNWFDPLAGGLLLALMSLVFGLTTSYLRARAEGLGYECSVGIAERSERILIVSIGLIFPSLLIWALILIAIASVVTVVQRFLHVWKQTKEVPV